MEKIEKLYSHYGTWRAVAKALGIGVCALYNYRTQRISIPSPVHRKAAYLLESLSQG